MFHPVLFFSGFSLATIWTTYREKSALTRAFKITTIDLTASSNVCNFTIKTFVLLEDKETWIWNTLLPHTNVTELLSDQTDGVLSLRHTRDRAVFALFLYLAVEITFSNTYPLHGFLVVWENSTASRSAFMTEHLNHLNCEVHHSWWGENQT